MNKKILFGLLAFSLCSSFTSAADKAGFAELYEDAVRYAPVLNSAKFRFGMEQSRSKQVAARWLPQVSISATKSENESEDLITNVETDYDGEKYSLVARQKLYDRESKEQKSSAEFQAKSRGAEYEDAKDQLAVDLVERYFALLESQRAVTTIEAEVTALNERFRQVEKMYERKLVKITDLYEVRSRRDLAASQHIEAIKNLRLSEEYLVEIVGYRVADIKDLKSEIEFPTTENEVEYWVDQAMSNNPFVQSKTFSLQAAERDLSSKKWYMMPKVDLIYSHQRTDLGYENAQSNLRETDYIGVEVNMSLFAGGANRHRKQEAFYKREMSQQDLRLAQTTTARKVRDAYWGAKLSHAKIDATRQALDSYTKTHELMEKSYGYRTVTIADVLDALKEKFRAQLEYERARYEFVRQYIVLKKESGDLNNGDIQLVDNWLQQAL